MNRGIVSNYHLLMNWLNSFRNSNILKMAFSLNTSGSLMSSVLIYLENTVLAHELKFYVSGSV